MLSKLFCTSEVANLKTAIPDILIEPDLMQFGIFDFQQAKPMIQKGYDATQAKMPDIKKFLDN